MINNLDRHLCKKCKYRGDLLQKKYKNYCDYIFVTNHMRGCNVENCNKYEKGKKISKKINIYITDTKADMKGI